MAGKTKAKTGKTGAAPVQTPHDLVMQRVLEGEAVTRGQIELYEKQMAYLRAQFVEGKISYPEMRVKAEDSIRRMQTLTGMAVEDIITTYLKTEPVSGGTQTLPEVPPPASGKGKGKGRGRGKKKDEATEPAAEGTGETTQDTTPPAEETDPNLKPVPDAETDPNLVPVPDVETAPLTDEEKVQAATAQILQDRAEDAAARKQAAKGGAKKGRAAGAAAKEELLVDEKLKAEAAARGGKRNQTAGTAGQADGTPKTDMQAAWDALVAQSEARHNASTGYLNKQQAALEAVNKQHANLQTQFNVLQAQLNSQNRSNNMPGAGGGGGGTTGGGTTGSTTGGPVVTSDGYSTRALGAAGLGGAGLAALLNGLTSDKQQQQAPLPPSTPAWQMPEAGEPATWRQERQRYPDYPQQQGRYNGR